MTTEAMMQSAATITSHRLTRGARNQGVRLLLQGHNLVSRCPGSCFAIYRMYRQTGNSHTHKHTREKHNSTYCTVKIRSTLKGKQKRQILFRNTSAALSHRWMSIRVDCMISYYMDYIYFGREWALKM